MIEVQKMLKAALEDDTTGVNALIAALDLDEPPPDVASIICDDNSGAAARDLLPQKDDEYPVLLIRQGGSAPFDTGMMYMERWDFQYPAAIVYCAKQGETPTGLQHTSKTLWAVRECLRRLAKSESHDARVLDGVNLKSIEQIEQLPKAVLDESIEVMGGVLVTWACSQDNIGE